MENIDEQLVKIMNLRDKVRDNPSKYNRNLKKYDGKWGLKLNLTNDFKEYVDRDALLGSTPEDVEWYKGFLKVHYNSEYTGEFIKYVGTELQKITENEKYVRKSCCVLSGKRGEGMGVRKIERPDPLTHFVNPNGSSSSNLGVDYYSKDFYNQSINKFDLDENEMDNMGFLIGPKEAKDFVYDDVEFKIKECGHPLGLSLLQGLRRIFRINRLQRKMLKVNEYSNRKNRRDNE